LSDQREFFNCPYPVPSQGAGSHVAQAILRIGLMGKQAGLLASHTRGKVR